MAVAIAIVSLFVAGVALAVNVSGLVRRPRIVAKWGFVQHEHEGLSVIVTARRRPIQVDEIGVVSLPGRPRRRQFPEWLNWSEPFRLDLQIERTAGDLPIRLQDGESVRAFIELDDAIGKLPPGPQTAYTFVKASGTVYLAPKDSKLKGWLSPRVGS